MAVAQTTRANLVSFSCSCRVSPKSPVSVKWFAALEIRFDDIRKSSLLASDSFAPREIRRCRLSSTDIRRWAAGRRGAVRLECLLEDVELLGHGLDGFLDGVSQGEYTECSGILSADRRGVEWTDFT